jgi:hypothetical protein
MTLELRGDDIVLLDLPADFTLPERIPVRWCTERQAYALSKRHSSVPALLKLLRERGLLRDVPEGIRGRSVSPAQRLRPAALARG